MRKIGYASERLASIDELRALAIISMMVAHFGPGTLLRLPGVAALMDPILFCGHFATVMFIIVFGITIGFVHYGRFWSGDRARTVSRLHSRARLVLLCVIVIRAPAVIESWLDGPVAFAELLFQLYSVLVFYVLGFLSAPYWLRALGQQPLRNGIVLGVGHWVVAAIILSFWQQDSTLSVAEYIRLLLVSGPYAYFQLTGSVLMAIPVGVYLQKSLSDGTSGRFMLGLILIGLGLTAAGWALGVWVHEFDVRAIVDGVFKAPPRVWYWMFFAGPVLLVLAGLVAIELHVATLSKLLYPLALFGMGALPIYTVHTFVIPMLKLLDMTTEIEGLGRIALPFAVFGVYCLIVMQHYHGKLKGRNVTSRA
jgi:hypothetical protein